MPDRFYIMPNKLPLIGDEINILPIIMAVAMFIQQKITMTGATGAAAEQQKMMLIIMPVMFGFIFYGMPSGLVLYWFINSLIMLIFQTKIQKAHK
jgi:YidC/Oxa1 family membrane protein insertase